MGDVRLHIPLALCLFFIPLIGCGGATQQVSPTVESIPVQPTLKDRFEKAWIEVSCMANEGVDPLMTMTPLRKPRQFIEGLIETKSPKLDVVRRILDHNGFSTINLFLVAENRFRADHSYWDRIESLFVDELLKCK